MPGGPVRLNSFLADEAGATAIEYALIASLVSIGCIAALINFADSMDVLYTIVAAMTAAAAGT